MLFLAKTNNKIESDRDKKLYLFVSMVIVHELSNDSIVLFY